MPRARPAYSPLCVERFPDGMLDLVNYGASGGTPLFGTRDEQRHE